MTDALAQWFLHELDVGGSPIQELRDVFKANANRQSAFYLWLDAQRAAHRIRNDDTTLGWVQVTTSYTGAGHEFTSVTG